MRELTRMASLEEFRRAFDNGGHLWSVFSHRGDGVITKGEVAHAAGSLAASSYAVLLFEMHRLSLSAGDGEQALAMLDAGMRRRHHEHEPARVAPSRLEEVAAGRAAVAAGTVSPHPDPASVGGTITWFIPVGDAIVPMVRPLIEHFELRLLHDDASRSGPGAVLAVPRGTPAIPGRARVGGIVQDILPPETRKGPWRRFLSGLLWIAEPGG